MSSIEDRIYCNVCETAVTRRCPACGAPFCDAHLLTRELCLECELELDRRVGRIKIVFAGLLALLGLVVALCAALTDASVLSGLAAVAISVPALLLASELCGRLARSWMVTRSRPARAAAAATGAADPASDEVTSPAPARS
jgi:uncharacterized protein (DUF983 family)